jgi:hypothetical protein
MTSVAPNVVAMARRSAFGSTAMIRPAPQTRAPWITLSPTPPQPSTTTDEPGCTFAALTAEP